MQKIAEDELARKTKAFDVKKARVKELEEENEELLEKLMTLK